MWSRPLRTHRGRGHQGTPQGGFAGVRHGGSEVWLWREFTEACPDPRRARALTGPAAPLWPRPGPGPESCPEGRLPAQLLRGASRPVPATWVAAFRGNVSFP